MKHIPTFDWYTTQQVPTVDVFDVHQRRMVQIQPWYASADVHSLTDMPPFTSPRKSSALWLAEALTDSSTFSAACCDISSLKSAKCRKGTMRGFLNSEPLSYLKSKSEVWALMCALSCNKRTPRHKEGETGADSDTKDFICQGLLNTYPALGRLVLRLGSQLLGGCQNLQAEELISKLSVNMPDDYMEILFSCMKEQQLHEVLYKRTTLSVSTSKFHDATREIGILPSSLIRESLVWTALHDFALTCLILGGISSVTDAITKISQVFDPFLRSRLALKFATLKQFNRDVVYDMLSQCAADLNSGEINSVVRTCIMELTFQDEVRYTPGLL
jgi:hypothetical protein